MHNLVNSVYQPISANSVRVHGWLEQQSNKALAGFIGSLPLISKEVWGEVFASGQLGPEAAGVGENVANTDWWNGESEGNWLIGWVGHVLLHADDAALESVRAYLQRILDHQSSEGYIGMFNDAARAKRAFIVGDLWTQSRALLALQLWASYWDDDSFRDCVSRALDYSIARYLRSDKRIRFAPESGDSCGRGHDLMFMDALAEQTRQTGEARFVEFGRELYADYSAAELDWHETDGQLHRLLSEEPIVGHGAHAVEYLRVPLYLAEHAGGAEYLAAFTNGMSKIEPAIGIGGSVKSDEQISLPGVRAIPLPESGYELCTMLEMVTTLLEAARVTGRFHYLDLVEKLFLNDAQAAVTNDGSRTTYCLAQNQPQATHTMGTRWDLSPTHDDVAVCCTPNAGKILPTIARRMVALGDEGISFQLYGPMSAAFSIDGTEVDVRQETGYPFEERIVAHIQAPESRFTVEFRVPEWCERAQLTVVGATDVVQERRDDRFRVTATWAPHSFVELDLPQDLILRTLPDGRYVVGVGPLVFSVPIEHEIREYRDYAVDGFSDQDIVPASAQWIYPPFFREADLATAEVIRRASPGDVYPWSEQPSVSVRMACWNPNPHEEPNSGHSDMDAFNSVELVPLGTTLLRWTALPPAR